MLWGGGKEHPGSYVLEKKIGVQAMRTMVQYHRATGAGQKGRAAV